MIQVDRAVRLYLGDINHELIFLHILCVLRIGLRWHLAVEAVVLRFPSIRRLPKTLQVEALRERRRPNRRNGPKASPRSLIRYLQPIFIIRLRSRSSPGLSRKPCCRTTYCNFSVPALGFSDVISIESLRRLRVFGNGNCSINPDQVRSITLFESAWVEAPDERGNAVAGTLDHSEFGFRDKRSHPRRTNVFQDDLLPHLASLPMKLHAYPEFGEDRCRRLPRIRVTFFRAMQPLFTRCPAVRGELSASFTNIKNLSRNSAHVNLVRAVQECSRIVRRDLLARNYRQSYRRRVLRHRGSGNRRNRSKNPRFWPRSEQYDHNDVRIQSGFPARSENCVLRRPLVSTYQKTYPLNLAA